MIVYLKMAAGDSVYYVVYNNEHNHYLSLHTSYEYFGYCINT